MEEKLAFKDIRDSSKEIKAREERWRAVITTHLLTATPLPPQQTWDKVRLLFKAAKFWYCEKANKFLDFYFVIVVLLPSGKGTSSVFCCMRQHNMASFGCYVLRFWQRIPFCSATKRKISWASFDNNTYRKVCIPCQLRKGYILYI